MTISPSRTNDAPLIRGGESSPITCPVAPKDSQPALTKLIAAVKADPICRLLMTCPGVGVVVAASYSSAIEAPSCFRHSRSIGAYLGLTPRRNQSGEIDQSAGVSKRGDQLLRSYLFEAAPSLLVRVQSASALKTWGLALVQRLGFKRAAVAVARKIGVVLHAMRQTTSRSRLGRRRLPP